MSESCQWASTALDLVKPVQQPTSRAHQILQVHALRRDQLHGRIEDSVSTEVKYPKRAREAEVGGIPQRPGECQNLFVAHENDLPV